MKCPWCHALENRVMDSRYREGGAVIRRRRKCLNCDRRFTTYEQVGDIFPMVEKKDKRREAFSREKILAGIRRACEKLPVSVEQMEDMVNRIETHVCDLGEKEVGSTVIGDLVMMQLREINQVAYVRFASVYRTFNDIDDFMGELRSLVKAGKHKKLKARKDLPVRKRATRV